METVLIAITDLIFMVRIGDAVKRAGRRAAFAGTLEKVVEQMEGNPALVVIDLSCVAVVPTKVIEEAKARGIRTVAFGPHVDVESLKTAREAGAWLVLPRSKFVEKLDEIVAAAEQ